VSARDEVLRRVRTAVGPRRAAVQVPRNYRGATDLPPENLTDLLVDRLEDYRAVVHRTPEAGVGDLLRTLELGCVLVPEGFPTTWLPGLDVVRDTGLTPRELDAVDAVLTTCAIAIAETGTLVLDSGSGQGRRALTLVPDHHVVLVREDQVVGSVPEAFRLLAAARPQTWISGPSATSDIELQRVEGVHGPRLLEVVIMSADSR
jgi:L-lactate dehydrogenase complex protein LldG